MSAQPLYETLEAVKLKKKKESSAFCYCVSMSDMVNNLISNNLIVIHLTSTANLGSFFKSIKADNIKKSGPFQILKYEIKFY